MAAASAQFQQNSYGYVSGRHVEARRRLESLARLLDSAVRIPGTDIRIGLDPVLNIVPGVGILTAKAMAGYLIWEARKLGAPGGTILRMLGNLGIDFVISSIPLVGWLGDIFYRANNRNIELLRQYLDRCDGVVDTRRARER